MDAAEEVKTRLDIADIVGEYLQLKPAGTGSFKACCPFHAEHTPSFFVNRGRQSWHCFGCDKGGDSISFVMAIEGMEFRDALEHLAQKAGVQLPSFDPEQSSKKKRLIEVNELAARFFRAQLLQSTGAAHAREYAAKRQIDDLTGDLFHIGYAPNSWDALHEALASKGIADEDMVDAGLCSRRQDGSGIYDRFRDRLMFAIQDIHGHVVGFTGRLLNADAKEAKYVNSPETMVYKKSLILYGLDKAKGDIRSKDLCVIVEGNMDALSSHRVNVCNVVASSGTALTAEQLKLIARFTKNIAIAFDSDGAGVEATIRGLDLARAQDFAIRVISLPPEAGKDPDDAISKDPGIWKQAIADSIDIIDWIFKRAFKGKTLSNPNDVREAAEEILPEIKRIQDPIVRDHWIKKLSNALTISESALLTSMNRLSSAKTVQFPRKEAQAQQQASNPRIDRKQDLLEQIFAVLVHHPNHLSHISEELIPTLDELYFSLYTQLQNGYDPLRSPNAAPEHIERLVSYLVIRADRDNISTQADKLLPELQASISAYKVLIRSEERKRLEQEMREAELAGDKERVNQLNERFNKLQS